MNDPGGPDTAGDPLPHLWPDADALAEHEVRHGIAYCRRCGYLLAGHGVRSLAARPCRPVSVRPRRLTPT